MVAYSEGGSRLRVFENRVLREIFGPKGEWRKQRNKELYDLYCLPSVLWVIKSRRMRWAGHVARIRERRGVYRVLMGRPEGKKPLGRPRHKWQGNIKMDLQEVRCRTWAGLIWLKIGTGGGLL